MQPQVCHGAHSAPCAPPCMLAPALHPGAAAGICVCVDSHGGLLGGCLDLDAYAAAACDACSRIHMGGGQSSSTSCQLGLAQAIGSCESSLEAWLLCSIGCDRQQAQHGLRLCSGIQSMWSDTVQGGTLSSERSPKQPDKADQGTRQTRAQASAFNLPHLSSLQAQPRAGCRCFPAVARTDAETRGPPRTGGCHAAAAKDLHPDPWWLMLCAGGLCRHRSVRPWRTVREAAQARSRLPRCLPADKQQAEPVHNGRTTPKRARNWATGEAALQQEAQQRTWHLTQLASDGCSMKHPGTSPWLLPFPVCLPSPAPWPCPSPAIGSPQLPGNWTPSPPED